MKVLARKHGKSDISFRLKNIFEFPQCTKLSRPKYHYDKILTSRSSSLDFRMFSTDVTKPYLPSQKKLRRDNYVKPSIELRLDHSETLKQINNFYGIDESADYFPKNVRNSSQKETKKAAYICRPTFLFRQNGKFFHRKCVTSGDNTLKARENTFSKISKYIEKKFQWKAREWDSTPFTELEINQEIKSCYSTRKNTQKNCRTFWQTVFRKNFAC